jgi:hypothetical protein
VDNRLSTPDFVLFKRKAEIIFLRKFSIEIAPIFLINKRTFIVFKKNTFLCACAAQNHDYLYETRRAEWLIEMAA